MPLPLEGYRTAIYTTNVDGGMISSTMLHRTMHYMCTVQCTTRINVSLDIHPSTSLYQRTYCTTGGGRCAHRKPKQCIAASISIRPETTTCNARVPATRAPPRSHPNPAFRPAISTATRTPPPRHHALIPAKTHILQIQIRPFKIFHIPRFHNSPQSTR